MKDSPRCRGARLEWPAVLWEARPQQVVAGVFFAPRVHVICITGRDTTKRQPPPPCPTGCSRRHQHRTTAGFSSQWSQGNYSNKRVHGRHISTVYIYI